MSRPGPCSPQPVRDHGGDHLPAYLSNGVVGLRVRENPLLAGVAVVTGLAGVDPEQHIESAPFVPYPLSADVQVGRVPLRDAVDAVRRFEQRYDFSCGELHTDLDIELDGVAVHLAVITFCSRTQPTVVAQEITASVDRACDLALRAVIDPGGISGRWADRAAPVPGDGVRVDGALRWETSGGLSSCGLAYTTEILGTDATPQRATLARELPLATTYAFRARSGARYVLRQLTSVVGSVMHSEPDRAAVRLVARARDTGFEALRRDNAAAWAELWQARPLLDTGDDRWQAFSDAAYFYMNSSVHSSSTSATHIFGLARWTNYHYYYGHVMWDIEAFALPPLLLSQPAAARAILDYRSRSLPAARTNAQLNGFDGIQFPWQSGPRYGEESAPGEGDAAAYEHHVNMAVARAFVQYADASGDHRFLRERACEVLDGVATWLAGRVERSERGYEIRRAMGIAEREQPSDNVAYVNMSASVVLRLATRVFRQVGLQPPASWLDIADHIVLPLGRRGTVVLDHDGYTPNIEKGATPATLAGIFPVGYELDADVQAATIRYYLEMWRDYVGSPMLSALYPTWATRVGDRRLAAKLLDEGYAKFVSPRFTNTHEYREDRFPEQPVAGPFFANLAGLLLDLYFGFPRLEIGPGDPASWVRGDVVLPSGWNAIEVERLWVRNRPARLVARHGKPAELRVDD